MKRPLQLLGLFLPLLETTKSEALHLQYHVQPSQRNVQYTSKSNIPSSSSVLNGATESKTQKYNGRQSKEFSLREEEQYDDGWYLHVDATYEHPDEILTQVLNKKNDDYVEHSEATKKSWFRWWRDDDTVNNQAVQLRTDLRNRMLSSEDDVISESVAVEYNVSVETEHNVILDSGETTASAGVSSNSSSETSSSQQQSDSSTVLFISTNTTTSGENTTNINSNISSSNTSNIDDEAVLSNSTTNDKKSQFRPLRFRSFLSNVEGGGIHLTSYQRSILLQDIMKPALLSWSTALRVDPVIGNLTVDRNQLVDGKLCGPGGDLPSFPVPTAHMAIGVPDTDFILYIHLAYISSKTNNSVASDSNVQESMNGTDSLNNSTIDDVKVNYNNSSSSNRTSTTNVTVFDESHKKLCAGDYLAAASFCSTDQFDRPTAAILHICIGDDFFMKSNLKTNILVVRHELGHALGFNAISLAHFRRPNGQPYTDRDPRTGEIPITEVNCTGPISSNRTGLVALPSSEVLQFRIVRGGVRVAEIVTPSVRQVVRNHFDCQTLPGAELESGEYLPLSTNPGEISCIGDHWERRLFKTDLMNPLVDDNVEFTTRFSTITLAYFADSGWYQVDLSRATTSAGWGRAAGCDFVEQTCVNADDGQVPSSFDSFFCNQIPVETAESGYAYEIHGCTTDLTKKATCSIGHVEGEIPQAYQYFNFKYGANVGGVDPYMDYCPVYSGFLNGLCSDSQNEALIKVNYIERFGQRNSRCLSGKITSLNSDSAATGENSTEFGESTTSTGSSTESTALCLPIACVVEDRTLRIQVNGVWMVCHYKGEVLTPVDDVQLGSSDLPVNLASIVCPDPIRVCPTFYCHRDCLGTSRVCDYNVGKCVCSNSISFNASSSDFASWDGKSFTNSNETNIVTCSTPKEVNDTTDSSSIESFYQPKQSDLDDEFPASDSPLSDYYYKSERNLKEESSTGFWNRKSIGLFSGICALALIALTSYMSRIVRARHGTIEVEQEFDGSGSVSRLDNDPFNPNKDKLMAAVVVNLRMNDSNLQRLNRNDPLSSRDSETDTSMTDTDGASEIQSSLDLSLEFSAQSTTHNFGPTIVDLAAYDNAAIDSKDFNGGGLYDDVDIDYVDPLAPPSVRMDTKANVRRRRHIFAQLR